MEGGTNRGQAFVFEWNGSDWVKLGNTSQGTQDGEYLGYAVAISGDGNYIAVGSLDYDDGSTANVGRHGVFYLVGATWTIFPDSGSLTETESGVVDYFTGSATNDRAGYSLKLSTDGKTIAAGYRTLPSGAGVKVVKFAYIHTRLNKEAMRTGYT